MYVSFILFKIIRRFIIHIELPLCCVQSFPFSSLNSNSPDLLFITSIYQVRFKAFYQLFKCYFRYYIEVLDVMCNQHIPIVKSTGKLVFQVQFIILSLVQVCSVLLQVDKKGQCAKNQIKGFNNSQSWLPPVT